MSCERGINFSVWRNKGNLLRLEGVLYEDGKVSLEDKTRYVVEDVPLNVRYLKPSETLTAAGDPEPTSAAGD